MITLTTDFGQSSYVAAMKGVILGIRPEARIVDLSHGIRSGDVRQGAFLLQTVLPYFPKAVHVAVVDPGVGAGRRGVAIACERGTLVGPDNGLLLPAARKLGLQAVHELTNQEYWNQPVSSTFHGRDVFAPVGAHLDRGAATESVGPILERFVDLDFGTPKVDKSAIDGEVILADHFGNLVTNVPEASAEPVFALGDRLRVTCGGASHIVSYVPSYGFAPAGEPLLLTGSSGYLELAVNRESAAKRFGADAGTEIRIERM